MVDFAAFSGSFLLRIFPEKRGFCFALHSGFCRVFGGFSLEQGFTPENRALTPKIGGVLS
ncbi:hypothetical protein K6W37_16360 [Acetobacter senegalensis]|uniref:hypothetical protein n=1 Tax=Acetobacter senegalensis TaxID=446692 RepID=UPI001EDAA042|nr:hypothetical protein [Acetobacter senegalensis]MCG4255428.1 hypothetical protein [Acetobacter senegalensis]